MRCAHRAPFSTFITMRRRICNLLLVLSLAGSPMVIGVEPAFAAQNLNVKIADHFGSGISTSKITTEPGLAMLGGGGYFLCTSTSDPKCASSAVVTAMLPVCKSATEANCVEALFVTSPNAQNGAATLLKTIGKKAFDADPANGIPEGSSWSLFEVPELKAAGDQSLYAVNVTVAFKKFPLVGFKATDFSAAVVPYVLGSTQSQDPYSEQFVDPTGKVSVRGLGGDPNCVWVESGVCGIESSFPKESRIKLTVHVGNYLTSWLHGRLTDPNITISSISTQQNRLTVDAVPVIVPAASTAQPVDALNAALTDRFRDPNRNLPPGDISMLVESSQSTAMDTFGTFEKFFSNKANRLDSVWSFRALGASAAASFAPTSAGASSGSVSGPISGLPSGLIPSSPGSLPSGATSGLTTSGSASGILGAITGMLGSPTSSASSIGSAVADALGMGAAAAKCASQVSSITGAILGSGSSTALVGLVTTNAMTYDAKPPQFKDGSLDYKVAGLHLNPDDSVFSGRYDLVMDAKVARCLYGYSDSNAPLQASVEIIDNDGTSRVTTSSLRESGGWLKLGVYGFNFSSPTLKVKLSQATPVVKAETSAGSATTPAPTPNSSAPAAATSAPAVMSPGGTTPSNAKVKTISCVKGKTVKKVTGANPRCPAGFKLKS